MKIIEDTSKKEDNFGDLCIGDIFMYSDNINNIFIKVESLCGVTNGKITNAIRLKDGALWNFAPDGKVEKLEATLAIKR